MLSNHPWLLVGPALVLGASTVLFLKCAGDPTEISADRVVAPPNDPVIGPVQPGRVATRPPPLAAREKELPQLPPCETQATCPAASWCAQSVPTQNPLNAIWGSSDNDVWAVGDHGTIVRRTGGAWEVVPSGTGIDLVDVRGTGTHDPTGAEDVWAVGQGAVGIGPTLLHWRGSGWQAVYITSVDVGEGFTYVHPIAWNNVYLASEGKVLHGDGLAWMALPPPARGTLRGTVWAYADDDVWASGLVPSDAMSGQWVGAMFHFDGRSWRDYPHVTGGVELSGTVPRNDLWSLGDGEKRALVRWDGHTWSRPEIPVSVLPVGTPFSGVHAVARNVVWASTPTSLLFWDGGAWSSQPTLATLGVGLARIWAPSDKSVWATTEVLGGVPLPSVPLATIVHYCRP